MEFLVKTGLTSVHMAKHFACSTSLVYKQLKLHNINIRSKYSKLTDAELDDRIRDIHANHVNAGNELRPLTLKCVQ
jgi:hypothetical protein